MPNESPTQRRARENRQHRDHTRTAAKTWRADVGAGRYTGLSGRSADTLYYVAAVLDTAEIEMDELPEKHKRAILNLVERLVPSDDPRRPGPVAALSDGDGH